MIEDVVPDGTMKIKFLRNTSYNGADYGPDYETDTAVVESRQATIWIQNERAVEAMAPVAEDKKNDKS